MKNIAVLILAVLLSLSVCSVSAMGEDQGVLGRLTKLNVDEVSLTNAIADSYFAKVPFSGYQFFDNLNSMIAALSSGHIAGMTIDEYTAQYLLSRSDEYAIYTPDDSAPSYNLTFSMLLREEDTERCSAVSAAIADMKADGTLEALKQNYIDDVIAGKEPEAVVPAVFDGAETLKVALTGDRPPMDYYSAAGDPIGFNTALMSEVGRRMGINIEFVPMDTSARAVALASGNCDVVFWMEAGDYGDWEKADVEDQPENTIVTTPYLKDAFTLVVLASSPLVSR